MLKTNLNSWQASRDNEISLSSYKCLWESSVYETVICVEKEGLVQVLGGSDKGEFPFVHQIETELKYQNGAPPLTQGSIILEVQGQKVAGYTQKDVLAWLHHCTRNGNPCVIRAVHQGEYSITWLFARYCCSQ